jgi:hypothetical protein
MNKGGALRLISLHVPDHRLRKDLKIFKKKALERGRGKKCFDIVGRIETLALGEDYYLAMGFGQASCRRVLCGQELCAFLNGGKCPYPLKVRPSMEGVEMDVYGLVTRVGWDIYPIYRSVNPEEA